MFSLDRWQEILDTLWRNKLRSALTALSMAWGIFMLVLLLGLGNGLQAGVQNGFADDATNSIWIFAGQTSKPADGLPVGRRIVFKNPDVDTLDALAGVDQITGRFFARGGAFGGDIMMRAGAKAQSFDVRAVHPGHLYIEKTLMKAGRFLNERDLETRRKVVVVGIPVAEFLFGSTDVIGRWVEINRVPFQIVGVFDDEGDPGEAKKAYVPITTAQAAFNGADRVNMIMFTIDEDAGVEESKRIATEATAALAERHHFAPDDPQAVRVRNNVENFQKFMEIFAMIEFVMTLMGILAIVAGVIGISNIMLIVVRERTKEIGIRKALGATPGNIVGSIVQESVFLTSVAGYLGLVGGVVALWIIEVLFTPNEMFGRPYVDLWIGVAATGVLVAAGAFAGFFPALQAAKVNPIVALRDE